MKIRKIFIKVAIGAILIGVAFFVAFWLHEYFPIRQLNLGANDPLVGKDVMAAPLSFYVGQPSSRQELVSALLDCGYLNVLRRRGAGQEIAFETGTSKVRIELRGSAVRKINIDDGAQDSLAVPCHILQLLDLHDHSGDFNDLLRARRLISTHDELFDSYFPDAIRASEDEHQSDGGIDLVAGGKQPVRYFRAAIHKGFTKARPGGSSTISMQVARACILQDYSPTIWRKVREVITSSALSEQLGRDRILEIYANCINTGLYKARGQWLQLYGVKAALLYKFGKVDLRDATPTEAATIVAAFPSPNRWNKPETLIEERNLVLGRMEEVFPKKYAGLRSHAHDPLNLHRLPIDPAYNRASFGFFTSAAHIDEKSRTPGAVLQTTMDPNLQFAAVRSVRQILPELRTATAHPELQATIVVLDPHSGSVLACVGGFDFSQDRNLCLDRNLPGSLNKPPVLAQALVSADMNGSPVTPITLIDLADGHIGDWPRKRSDGIISVATALAVSNDPAAIVIGKAVDVLTACNIIDKSYNVKAVCGGPLLLGQAADAEVSPLEVASAYSAFLEGGNKPKPVFFNSDVKSKRPIFDSRSSFLVLHLMRGVPIRGTLRFARNLARIPNDWDVAAKTGTTQYNNRLWVVSVHPNAVVVVELFDHKPLPNGESFQAGHLAGKLWADYISRASAAAPHYFAGKFPPPPEGVVLRAVDRKRGCIYSRLSGYDSEYFLRDRLPPECHEL